MKRFLAHVMPAVGLARLAYWFLVRPRTRGAKVVLLSNGEVLLVRHTYERGIYGLPGGGLRSGEDPEAGLRREVREELGIELPALRFLGTVESEADYARNTVHVFSAELASRAGLVPDPIEIAELRWAPLGELPPVGAATAKILALAA